MDDKNLHAQNTPQVDIPNFKKDKKEKKRGGVPIPGGGIARSAATNLVKAIGREGGEALVRQGADAAARGFLPQLFSSLGGKALVAILALAMGGGAIVVIKNAGQSASPQKAANLGAINSTIALPRTMDNTALNYAAKSGKAETQQSPVPTAPVAADNAASNDSGLKNTGAGQTAQAASGGPVGIGAPAAPDAPGAGAGTAPMADQMDHGMGKLSLDFGGGGSGGFSAGGSSGLKSGKMQQFSATQKSAGGKGGKLMASNLRQAAASPLKIGNRGRNFLSKGMARLNGMGNLFSTVGKVGSHESDVSTLVEGYEGTKGDGQAPVTPVGNGTPTPANQVSGGVRGGGHTSWCSKMGQPSPDGLATYMDNGKGDGGCTATPNQDVSRWTRTVAAINDLLSNTLILSIITLCLGIVVFAALAWTGFVATACSEGFLGILIAAGGILTMLAALYNIISAIMKLYQYADDIKGMPGTGDIGDNLHSLADWFIGDIVAVIVPTIVAFAAGPPGWTFAAGVGGSMAGGVSGAAAIEEAFYQDQINSQAKSGLTDTNADIAKDQLHANDPPK